MIDDSDIVSIPVPKLETEKEFPGISTTSNNLEAATGLDNCHPCQIKPWFYGIGDARVEIKSKQILISVAAGISFEELAHYVVAPEMPHIPSDSEHRYPANRKA